ncbi:unnamed protein product [Colias eurytheme]|nr:unnamed protein product [Colias eurytheme]
MYYKITNHILGSTFYLGIQTFETEGLSSGCEATGVREEIARNYAALQSRLTREFSDRHPGKGVDTRGARPVATEDQLSADFHKKLTEWQRMKGARQPPPIPARQDLSEDFLKRWDAWTRMKETNSVPAWEEEAKPDEVLVQTSTGLFKFQGISRSFTRKLHEWEKSRGIAPEASTSALLQAARARGPAPALTRAQSDGSVGPALAAGGRVHASSLSVNDADDLESDYERDHLLSSENSRGAVIVEVEAEEVCTAAPLVAVSPLAAPHTPVYTYGPAERPLTGSAARAAALPQAAVISDPGPIILRDQSVTKTKSSREQIKITEKTSRRRISRQTSIEEDAKFIRQTIEEIERGSRCKESVSSETEKQENYEREATISKSISVKNLKQFEAKEIKIIKDCSDDTREDKRKEIDKSNGKKKTKSRARLEREQSKPSESDTEPEVDTVTVEIPRRKKRPRRPSERPRTPPTSLHSDSEGEVFVLKIKTQEVREKSPEVIVKTTRKIFSPVVRSGETIPRAVIPVDVEDLPEVRNEKPVKKPDHDSKVSLQSKGSAKGSGDLQDDERPKTRPPLPTSPSSQRKPPSKETAPSIRIMIQRYNKKINEEGPASGGSSGNTSPAWRSPKSERRRPPDMPVGVNIRNNPFLEREVQKSASACQLSRRDQTSVDKCLTPAPQTVEGVLKSHSANTLHPEVEAIDPITSENSQENIPQTLPIEEKIVPKPEEIVRTESDSMIPEFSRIIENPVYFARSISEFEESSVTTRLSERAAKIREARERFLSSPPPMRREGTSSASDLRPGDRSSRVSCESDVTEAGEASEAALGRSASTGMVNIDRDSWQRLAQTCSRSRPRSRFSLARLAAKLRRKEDGAVARLCRQSLLVHLRKQ